jgi:hypothetical protein
MNLACINRERHRLEKRSHHAAKKLAYMVGPISFPMCPIVAHFILMKTS